MPEVNPVKQEKYSGHLEEDDIKEAKVIHATLDLADRKEEAARDYNEQDKNDGSQEDEKLRKFKEAVKRQRAEVKDLTSNGFWTCLVFPSEEVCYEFLEKTGWIEFAERYNAYVDGLSVAEQMGIELESLRLIRFRTGGPDKRLVNEVGVYDSETDEAPDLLEDLEDEDIELTPEELALLEDEGDEE